VLYDPYIWVVRRQTVNVLPSRVTPFRCALRRIQVVVTTEWCQILQPVRLPSHPSDITLGFTQQYRHYTQQKGAN
jgi:hypothetical protein